MENRKKRWDTKNMVLMAFFAGVTCVLAPLSVPIGPVPISLTNLVIYFSIFILGWQRATITYLVYLLIGMAGLPVFSGFESGVGKFVGPTGGYLVGFILMTIVSGLFIQIRVEKTWLRKVLSFTGMVVGTTIAYAFGTVWFCFSTGSGIWAALLICVFPFVIGDIVKMALAIAVAPVIAARIQKIT